MTAPEQSQEPWDVGRAAADATLQVIERLRAYCAGETPRQVQLGTYSNVIEGGIRRFMSATALLGRSLDQRVTVADMAAVIPPDFGQRLTDDVRHMLELRELLHDTYTIARDTGQFGVAPNKIDVILLRFGMFVQAYGKRLSLTDYGRFATELSTSLLDVFRQQEAAEHGETVMMPPIPEPTDN